MQDTDSSTTTTQTRKEKRKSGVESYKAMDKGEKVGMEDELEMVAKAFVNHYYSLFDTNRASLSSLYATTSILSFEGHKLVGVDEISRKLVQLPFVQCQHIISTIDCQPSPSAGGILIVVSGNIHLLGEEHQLKFGEEHQLYLS